MPEQAPQPQDQQMEPALTHQDYLNIKYLLQEPPMSLDEAWKRLPREVRDWLVENGFDNPGYVMDPVDAFVKLAMALAYGEDYYDYSVDVVKTSDGDAIIIDVWIPTLGYDTVIIVLPDGDVVAFQYS